MALENQLLAGDAVFDFGFPTAMGGGPPGLVNIGVVDATFKVKRVREKVKKRLFKKDKVITTVEYLELGFRWLPWVSGKINYAQTEGKDVLSGMFTGCWMSAYTEAGTRRVGHIATQKDAGDCKATWRRHRGLRDVSQVQEFRPDLGFAGEFNLGLVSAVGGLYKIQMSPAHKVTIANPWTTPEEWMDPAKGKTERAVAEIMATTAEVPMTSIYPGRCYRIDKIVGPLPPEDFPA